MDEKIKEQTEVQEIADLTENAVSDIPEQEASGTPYWNGIEQDSSGGYRFTGGKGQGGYAAYNTARNDGGSYNGSYGGSYATAPTKKVPGWVKGLIIFLVICLGLTVLGVACSNIIKGATGGGSSNEQSYDFHGDYIGLLYLEGTITDGVSGDGYNQAWILERIAQMADEKNNRGIMLHVNTPGGSAYATSEVYKALLDYKDKTGNPIYVYMGSQATSGGYYVSMAADKIYANEECWTGSIGVVVGTLYDFSELFEKYGIKAVNIVSGANKDMGSYAKPLTEEQLAILQSLVDDSFDRFVKAVVDGRGLSESAVRTLADGRIYTAKQALEGGLIDSIGTLDEAIADMCSANGLSNVKVETIEYVPEDDLLSLLGILGLQSQIGGSGATGVAGSLGLSGSDLAILMQLMEESTKASIEFICPIRK